MCVCTHVCVLGLHLGMEGGWKDVFGVLDTEQGPLPLLSHLDLPSNVCVRACVRAGKGIIILIFTDEDMKVQNG